MTSADTWGEPVSAGLASSVKQWNEAWTDALHFQGNSSTIFREANEVDDDFGLGSVFCAVYRILGGTPSSSPHLLADTRRARDRCHNPRERAHCAAMELLATSQEQDG